MEGRNDSGAEAICANNDNGSNGTATEARGVSGEGGAAAVRARGVSEWQAAEAAEKWTKKRAVGKRLVTYKERCVAKRARSADGCLVEGESRERAVEGGRDCAREGWGGGGMGGVGCDALNCGASKTVEGMMLWGGGASHNDSQKSSKVVAAHASDALG